MKNKASDKIKKNKASDKIKKNINKQYMQSIYLVLSDGTSGVFTGPKLVDTDIETEVTITSIKFSEPKELPQGSSFELITDNANDR